MQAAVAQVNNGLCASLQTPDHSKTLSVATGRTSGPAAGGVVAHVSSCLRPRTPWSLKTLI